MRGYLSIVPVALRGSTRLYMRRDSGDQVDSSLSGYRVQGTGRGTKTYSTPRPVKARRQRGFGQRKNHHHAPGNRSLGLRMNFTPSTMRTQKPRALSSAVGGWADKSWGRSIRWHSSKLTYRRGQSIPALRRLSMLCLRCARLRMEVGAQAAAAVVEVQAAFRHDASVSDRLLSDRCRCHTLVL